MARARIAVARRRPDLADQELANAGLEEQQAGQEDEKDEDGAS